MAEVNLGRIGFVNQGSWNNSANYKINDVVKYGGSTYAAKRPNVGVTPPTDGIDTDDWFYSINNSDYIDKTSNQDITGIKNFTISPEVPEPTDSNNAVNKAYVDGKYSGFKNYIINGKKVVNQRGLTSTDNSYNQDRWYKAGNNWFQGIEGNNNLISGKTYTLSWVGSAAASYYVGDATSSTINSQTFTPIENGESFALTISTGQNLWIKFESDATGSTFNFVQLEEGSVATPFENRPFGLEKSLCQRYHESSPLLYARSPYTSNSTATEMQFHFSFKVVKRVAPTFTYTGATLTNMNAFPIGINAQLASNPGINSISTTTFVATAEL